VCGLGDLPEIPGIFWIFHHPGFPLITGTITMKKDSWMVPTMNRNIRTGTCPAEHWHPVPVVKKGIPAAADGGHHSPRRSCTVTGEFVCTSKGYPQWE